MDIHQRINAFWKGVRPDQIPYTIYFWEWRHVKHDPAWRQMYTDGLGVTFHITPYNLVKRKVEVIQADSVERGTHIHKITQRTPVGEITAEWADGWHRKYWLETSEDYEVMQYIVEQTEVIADIERCQAEREALPPFGISLLALGRTPLQTILVDYAGLENFSMHLYDFPEEVHALYAALLDNFHRQVEITADAPGKFVSNLENFTAESLGPKRYQQFLLPVYEQCFPILHKAGKIVGCHYDGQTEKCKSLIAQAPIDLIESLTPPPEGDLTLKDARRAWPDKLFWSNINVDLYQLPPHKLRDVVLKRVADAAPDGKKLAFEVSEHLPKNWSKSMPIVLDALKETRA